MTDSSSPPATVPLGVGNIISDSFSILMSNIVKVLVLGFVGTFIGFIINQALVGDPAQSFQPGASAASIWVPAVLSIIISMVVYSLVIALLVQVAYDAKLNRSRPLGDYFGPAISAIVPLSVLSIAVGIMVGLAAIALLIPGLWVYAVFCTMAPAVVIEKAGFGALGRSAALTKEYRWPIAGALIVILIITYLIQLVAGFITVILGVGLASGFGGSLIFGIISSALGAIGYGLGGISVALIYARLREIKEGVGVDEIASVFD